MFAKGKMIVPAALDVPWTGGCGVVSQCSPHFTPHRTPRLDVVF